MHLSKATVLVFDRCMFPLMHIKIYLIHNEICFGSANFTDAAMFKNGLEALMRIDDEQQNSNNDNNIYLILIIIESSS